MLIDKNLRIKDAKYSYSDDVEDGSKSEYEIIDMKIDVNNNPFEIDPKQINASYKLKKLTFQVYFGNSIKVQNIILKARLNVGKCPLKTRKPYNISP